MDAQKIDCLFCSSKFQLPSTTPSLQSNISAFKGSQDDELSPIRYVDTYYPELLKGIVKVPETKFYNQGQTSDCPEPDLVADQNLSVPPGTIRNRQTSSDEEDVARNFLSWASNTNTVPCLILPNYEYSQYLKGNGNEEICDFLQRHKILGETDVICITKDRGVFICEIKSTFEGAKRVAEDIKKCWIQTQKSFAAFKAINSDIHLGSEVQVHKLCAFTNLSFSTLKQYLCDNHLKICMGKEVLSNQATFQKFIEDFLNAKGLEPGYSPNTLSKGDYKSIAGRYISLCSRVQICSSKQDVCKKISEKIKKVGSSGIYLTPTQKYIINQFSIHNGKLNKLIITGPYGAGKTLLMQIAARKLFKELQNDAERHVIIFSSLGCITGGKFYDNCDNFLEDVKNTLNDLAETKSNVDLIVGHITDDIMKPLGVTIKCNDCRLNHIKECSDDHPKNITWLEIVKVLHNAAIKYLGDQGGTQKGLKNRVHIFLDEVPPIEEHSMLLNKVTEENGNVIWLAARSEYYNQNKLYKGYMVKNAPSILNLKNFETEDLLLVLRNTRMIQELNVEMKNYMLSFWKIWKNSVYFGRNIIEIFGEGHPAASMVRKHDILETKYETINSGHRIDGLMPRLVILENCNCGAIKSILCHCLEKRIETVLKHSLCSMFHIQTSYNLTNVVKKLKEKVHISLPSESRFIEVVENVFKNNKIQLTIDDVERTDTRGKTSGTQKNGMIHIVNSWTTLGKEFDNLIYVLEDVVLQINPTTQDVSESCLLQNISRAKSQLYIIHPGAKISNDRYMFMRELFKQKCNTKEECDDLLWYIYCQEIIINLLFPNLIRQGSIQLLPLPSQKNLEQDTAIKLLMNGRDLEETLRYFNRNGNDVIKKHREENAIKQKLALTIFVKGVLILHQRLTGDVMTEKGGRRFHPLYTCTDNKDANNYINKIRVEEHQLLLNCGKCLVELGLIEESTRLFKFLVENFPNHKETVELLMNVTKESDEKIVQAAFSKHEEVNRKYEDMAAEINEMASRKESDRFVSEPENFVLWNMKEDIINSILRPHSGDQNDLVFR